MQNWVSEFGLIIGSATTLHAADHATTMTVIEQVH